MSLPRLLITGSMGKVAKILKRRLFESFEIYGVDLKENSTDRTYRADISDYGQISSVLRDIAPLPYLVHLAADARVDADWPSVLKNNLVGTRNVYEAAKQNEVKKVVFASSNHVTGAYEGIPQSPHEMEAGELLTVHDLVRPDSDYAVSKIFGEAVARQYYELYGIKSICLRLGSVLPDDDPTKNERFQRTWLSHRDLVQLVKKSIISHVGFGIYYGVSNNKNNLWDISNARKEIGFYPEDDASLY